MMKRLILVACWILISAIVASAQTTFYFPHLANGVLGGAIWKTTIFLTNPAGTGGATASGTITFNQDNSNLGGAGTPFAVTFTDESSNITTGTITFSIPAGGSKKYVSAGTGPYSPGFATVSTTAGTVNGTSIFSEFTAGGQLIGEAGVPQAAALPKQEIFVDTIGGYNIGVGYANPQGAAANVTFSLINSGGTTVLSTTRLFGPGNHAAGFTSGTSGFFPGVAPLAGTMQIVSDQPLATIALRFDPNFALFTTLPPVSISSVLNPAIKWLEDRPWLARLTSVARLLDAFQVRI
jgi:hypothetical protein